MWFDTTHQKGEIRAPFRIPISWLFVASAVAIRVPILTALSLHLDEQTFLNVGHDVASGHLPYLHLWDNKPPLLFFLIAPITIVAHHAILVVRLFAVAFDILTSLLVKKTSDVLFGEASTHWIAAVWCFAALSVRDGGGALMSETVALPFLMGGTLLLCARHPSLHRSFTAGLLLGAATMIRATPIFATFAAVIIFWIEFLFTRERYLFFVGALVALGGFCALVATILPYFVTGQLDMLVRSALLAPIAYVQERGQSSLVSEVVSLVTSKSIGGAILFGLIGLALGVARRPIDWTVLRIAAIWLALFVGLSRGPEGAFYLITLMPFACIFAALAFDKLIEVSSTKLVKIVVAAILLLPLPAAAITSIKRGNEPSATVATLAVLSREMRPSDTLYLTTDYMLYWMLDRAPPHPIVTHAGNLFRPAMFQILPFGMTTSADVMRAIVAAKPTWIVMETPNRYGEETDVGKVLQPALTSSYQLVPSPMHRLIYRLRDPTID
jgi:hypothetical protein